MSEIVDKIIACSKAIDLKDREYFTCPKCGNCPVTQWVIPLETSWRECPKCSWHDRPDNITVEELAKYVCTIEGGS